MMDAETILSILSIASLLLLMVAAPFWAPQNPRDWEEVRHAYSRV